MGDIMGEVCSSDAITRVVCAHDAVTRVDTSRGPRCADGPVGATPVHVLLTRELESVRTILGGTSTGWRQVVAAEGWISSAHVEMRDGSHVIVAAATHHDDRTARAQLLGELLILTGELRTVLAESKTVRVDYETICRPHVIARAA